MFTYNANVIIDQQKGVKIPLVCARLVIDCRLVMQMKLPAERRQMRMKKSATDQGGHFPRSVLRAFPVSLSQHHPISFNRIAFDSFNDFGVNP